MNNYIHWYYDPDCLSFFNELLSETQNKTKNRSIVWENSSYHNDSCCSIAFYKNKDSETYIQLYAFHNDKEAQKEDCERYFVVTHINGNSDNYCGYYGNDRNSAIKSAIEKANYLINSEV